ncbi:MAG: shikimate dehydrogenase [Magnetospiraceae bacterium]
MISRLLADGSAEDADIRVGMIGRGIDRSRIPAMHKWEAEAQGLAYDFRLFNTDRLDDPETSLADILAMVEAEGYAGVNITHPYKRDAMAYVDELSVMALSVGAINTIIFENGRRFGHNTDCWGFAEAFRRNLAAADHSRVLLLGAGGAGGAVATALMDNGVDELFISDVNAETAAALARSLGNRFGTEAVTAVTAPADIACNVTGIVNSSPVGTLSHPGLPLPADLLNAHHWVADIVYFPVETDLLIAARSLGCHTMPGSRMAVYQAARTFELFTGRKADPARMQACFDSFSDADGAPDDAR